MLPLVDKRWARVLRGSSPAWRVVSVGCTCDDDDDGTAHYCEIGDGRPERELDKPASAAATLDWFIDRPK